MERHALIKLRVATPADFANDDGSKKIGTAYFEMSSLGVIQPVVKYFSHETDLAQFKELYAYGQIYVMTTPNEARSIFNCIDWNLVESELEKETNLLNQIIKKNENKRAS